jgi:DNA-binding CsgD family transcriptional regulator
VPISKPKGDVDTDELGKLIEQIYEAPFAGQYSRALIRALARSLDSDIAAVMEQEPNSGNVHGITHIGFSDAAIRGYEDYYAHRSVLLKESAKYRQVGRIFSDHMIPRYSDYTRSETYNDFFAPQGADHLMQAHLERAGGRVTTLAFRRPADRGVYSTLDHDRFELLIPHLVNAARHIRLLSRQSLVSQSLIAALETLRTAVLVLDASNRVVFANRRADALLREGLVIRVRSGRLAATQHKDDAGLQEMLSSTRRSLNREGKRHKNHLVVESSGRERSVFISALPLTRRTAEPLGAHCAVIVFVSSSRRLRGAERVIGELYGLTGAEARVVAGLYDGLSVTEIAGASGTSRDAVRFHLKNVFQKLGVHRQSELIKLVSTGPASLFVDDER